MWFVWINMTEYGQLNHVSQSKYKFPLYQSRRHWYGVDCGDIMNLKLFIQVLLLKLYHTYMIFSLLEKFIMVI